MKKIEAYIRPERIEEVKDILDTLQLNGLSITQVMGCGNQKGWKEYVRGTEIDYNFLPKIKIETVIPDDKVEAVISGIIDKVYTGEYGDGKIFVYDVVDAIRIRTKDRGSDAIK